jgi:hypothetical protein
MLNEIVDTHILAYILTLALEVASEGTCGKLLSNIHVAAQWL